MKVGHEDQTGQDCAVPCLSLARSPISFFCCETNCIMLHVSLSSVKSHIDPDIDLTLILHLLRVNCFIGSQLYRYVVPLTNNSITIGPSRGVAYKNDAACCSSLASKCLPYNNIVYLTTMNWLAEVSIIKGYCLVYHELYSCMTQRFMLRCLHLQPG